MNDFTFVSIDSQFVRIQPISYFYIVLAEKRVDFFPALITVVSAANIVTLLSEQVVVVSFDE